MTKIKSIIKKYVHPFFILCMLLIILAGVAIIYNSRQHYASETWVYECLKAYGDNLTELDINILSKELSTEIDQKLGEFEFDTELSQDQLRELMAMVNHKMQYADYCISQEEIAAISADIVKKFLAENAVYATSHKQDALIDDLEKQLSEIKSSIAKLKEPAQDHSYSEQQIREIAKDAGLDEASVRKWINEMYPDPDPSDQDPAIKELARLLDVDAMALEKLAEQAKDTEDSIGYLTNRLGITEEKLNDALKQLSSFNSNDLSGLLAKLNLAEADLQTQITNNMSLTTSSITSVQNQVINNRNATDAAIASNKAETDKKISENKAYTDTAISELQNNVLFYEYDEDTNTLKLFQKPEGGK